jgi:SNF2 family DNA or RNA helicase
LRFRYKDGHELREYQLEGLNWLTFCWLKKQSAILADEMGLGKTVQSVVFVNEIFARYGMRGPFIVIAPLSSTSSFLFVPFLPFGLDAFLAHAFDRKE